MTTEEDFHRHLDAHPEDHTARMVFADYLDEQGDPRGPGYRALGKLKRRAYRYGESGITAMVKPEHFVGRELNQKADPNHDFARFPEDWYTAIPNSRQDINWTQFPSRHEAENAIALGFSKLPPERQQELLQDPVQMQRRVRMARKRRLLNSSN